MARHPLWNEEYWLLLLQLYQKKPMGVKPLYSKGMVDLSLELHIPPEFLHEQMFKLRMVTPRIKRLWEKYADKPQKLKRDIQRIRQMNGAETPYSSSRSGSEGNIREKASEPLESEPSLTRVKLIIILELSLPAYTNHHGAGKHRKSSTWGKLIRTSPKVIAEAMGVFMYCDPYLNREDMLIHPLLEACNDIWHQYGNGNPDKLYQLANGLKEYFK